MPVQLLAVVLGVLLLVRKRHRDSFGLPTFALQHRASRHVSGVTIFPTARCVFQEGRTRRRARGCATRLQFQQSHGSIARHERWIYHAVETQSIRSQFDDILLRRRRRHSSTHTVVVLACVSPARAPHSTCVCYCHCCGCRWRHIAVVWVV